VARTTSPWKRPSLISGAGQSIVAATFSSKRGTSGKSRRALATLRASARTAVNVRGSAVRWPISDAPPRVNDTCSETNGARSSAASAPSRRACASSMPSALPSESFTPWGTTGQISAIARASRRIRVCTKHVSATISTKSTTPRRASRSAASSRRHPSPTPSTARDKQRR
jgi:hypothetical protein